MLRTAQGWPGVVRFLTNGSIRFGSRSGWKRNPHCLCGFVTRTTHNREGFRPGWNETAVSTSRVLHLVLATVPGKQQPVRVSIAKMGQFGSRPVQRPDKLTPRGPDPVPYPSTPWFRRVWLDTSLPITGGSFQVSHLYRHSDMLHLIV